MSVSDRKLESQSMMHRPNNLYGKKGRRLREIERLEKILDPGEMSAELQRINAIGYNANTEETNILYAYKCKVHEYQNAQKKISLIKHNMN